MSWRRGQKTGRGKTSSWSDDSDSQEAPRRRWQDATRSSEVVRARPRRNRYRWAGTTAIALVLLGLLIWQLKRIPPTPFVVITATDYDAPIPINAWVLEDCKAFEKLNNRNLSMPDDCIRKWNKGLKEFALLPSSFDPTKGKSRIPVIVYVSAHGIVKDDGVPCLLPPGVSVDEPKNWIPVANLLKEIRDKVSPSRNTLLVLDCNRIRENWSLGIVYNTFAERVQKLVNDDSNPKLAVLMSASPGQVNWTSADLQGSVFAHYLQRGLEGHANLSENGGNGNKEVMLQELVSYLDKKISKWSQHNRGELQKPVLMFEGSDFHLTYVVGLTPEAVETTNKPEPVEDVELWAKLDEWKKDGLVRCDPIMCRNLEHQLLRLEELSQGGEEYVEKAKKLRGDITKATERKRLTEPGPPSAAYYYGLTKDAKWLHFKKNVGYTLPACEYFGVCNAQMAKKVREKLNRLGEAHSTDTLNSIDKDVSDVAQNLEETQFLAALGLQHVDGLWDSPTILSKVCDLRQKADNLAVPQEPKNESGDASDPSRESDGKEGNDKVKPGESVANRGDDNAPSSKSNGKPEIKKAEQPEPDSKPGDERAHYYTRFVINEVDGRRRRLEDLLFVGQQNAPPQYEKIVDETAAIYDWSCKATEDTSAAFRVRDDVFAEGPYLAEWLCDPLSFGVLKHESLVSKRLASLFDNAHKLNTGINNIASLFVNARELSAEINGTKELDNPKYWPSKKGVPFSGTTAQVQSDLQEVQNSLRTVTKLADKNDGKLAVDNVRKASEWRLLEAALRTPLIPWETRKALLIERAKLAEELHAAFFESEGTTKEEGNEENKESIPSADQQKVAGDYLNVIRGWEKYPLFNLLDIPAPDSSDKSNDAALGWCEKANVAVRKGLSLQTPAQVEKEKPVVPEEVDAIVSARKPLSEAEANLRVKAALLYEPTAGKADDDRIDKLRRFDIEQLLIWNGKRANDGYWQNTVVKDSSIPYFKQAAAALFDAAKELNQPEIVSVKNQILHGEKLAESEPKPLPIKASAALVGETKAKISLLVSADADVVPGLKGFASVFLCDESQRLNKLPASYVDMLLPKGTTKSFEVPIDIVNSSEFGSKRSAVTYFRGMTNPYYFRLPMNSGVRVEYVPQDYQEQSITLNGKTMQRSAIDFILDCSGSMKELTAKKSEVKSDDDKAQRLSLAKTQLKVMLHDLVIRESQGNHVGVRFFGHRVAWVNGVPNGTMAFAKGYEKEEQKLRQIGPGRDIEVVRPLGLFDHTQEAYIVRRLGLGEPLEPLEPWGFTPLYLSLKEALADFKEKRPEARKYIIAITDGKNDTTDSTTIAEVEAAWDEVRVPIYIMGFDMSADDLSVAAPAYKALTEKTGGEFFKVTNANDLLTTLRKTLQADTYTVSDSGLPPTELNKSTPIVLQRPKDFKVSFRSVKDRLVRLEGGEAIQLYVRDDNKEIKAYPYNSNVVEERHLQGVTSSNPILLRVHQPVRVEEQESVQSATGEKPVSVQFPISLQVDPEFDHFTRRPLETWVEITPLVNNKPVEPTYVFYDVNFERLEPVPVLKWTALNWPKKADKARIQFWCKDTQKTRPVQTYALRNLLTSKQSRDGVELSTTSTPEGDQLVIRIEESGEPILRRAENRIHVDLKTDPYKPTKVVHRFDDPRGVAIHLFRFPIKLRENIEATAQVVVSREKDRKDGALQLPADGIDVKVSEPVENFPARAISNGR